VIANGEVKSAAQKGGRSQLLAFEPKPGDIIFVPQKPLERSTTAQIMDALQIIRMAAETGAIGASIPNMHKTISSVDLGGSSVQQRTIVDEYRPELYESYLQWQKTMELQNE